MMELWWAVQNLAVVTLFYFVPATIITILIAVIRALIWESTERLLGRPIRR